MTIYVAGIDPGKGGGWAIYEQGTGRLEDAGPMVSPRRLQTKLTGCDIVLIERAQASPDMGVTSAFEYGRNFGMIEAVCQIVEAEILYCAPTWWKARLAVPVDKKAAVEWALELTPELASYIKKQADHGIAEAALIGQILLDDKLLRQCRRNNEKREAPKKKRPAYRL